jgi:hypothetical protein
MANDKQEKTMNPGFVVLDKFGVLVLSDSHDTPKGGVLFRAHGRKPATIFRLRKYAENAIDRTVNYAEKRGLTEWGQRGDHRIVKVAWLDHD